MGGILRGSRRRFNLYVLIQRNDDYTGAFLFSVLASSKSRTRPLDWMTPEQFLFFGGGEGLILLTVDLGDLGTLQLTRFNFVKFPEAKDSGL